MKLVFASNNAKKRTEIATILGQLDIELIDAEHTVFIDVIEDADTFAGNAQKKAKAFAQANHYPALADDSGLCVDALNGAPGIYSARFAGMHATAAEKASVSHRGRALRALTNTLTFHPQRGIHVYKNR